MLAFCLLLERHEDVVCLGVDNVATIDDLLSTLHKTCGQGDAVVEFVQAGLTAVLVVCKVGGQVVVKVALPQDIAMLCKCLIEEYLFVGRDHGVDAGDSLAVGSLTVDNADHTGSVLAQFVVLGGVHNALGIEVTQTIGDDAQEVVVETRDAVGIVFVELAYLLACHILVDDVVGLVEFHETIALGADDIVALVDGEVEGSVKVAVDPGATFFCVETELIGAWHEPHDDSDGAYNEGGRDKNVAPVEVALDVETTHYVALFGAKIR